MQTYNVYLLPARHTISFARADQPVLLQLLNQLVAQQTTFPDYLQQRLAASLSFAKRFPNHPVNKNLSNISIPDLQSLIIRGFIIDRLFSLLNSPAIIATNVSLQQAQQVQQLLQPFNQPVTINPV